MTAGSALLTDRLDATARAHPDDLALVHADRRLTWAEVASGSEHLARALLARGVSAGDHVGLWLPNRPDWVLLWLAAVRIGAAVVPVNTRYKADEAAYVLGKAGVTTVVVEQGFLGIDYAGALAGVRDRLPALRDVIALGPPTAGAVPWAEFTAGADTVDDRTLHAATATDPDARIIIVFTSGTTGFPKGVVHTHDAVRMMDTVADRLDLSAADRVLGHLPLFHVAGVFSSFLLALLRGGALVQMDHWDAAAALELVERERVSVLSGIPTHFVDLLSCPDLTHRDVTSLRTGWIGGSFIPPEVVRGARDRLGMAALLPVYGMTETTSTTTLARVTDPPESLLLGRGVPLGGYDVAVVDPATRTAVGVGVEGEVAVRGYTVMKGYWDEPEATAAVLDPDGWFYTGDLGTFDDEGYLRITGRRSDKFIVGGNNVHPADVERVLLAHPAVVTAHVVPRPDARLGEVGVAFVEPVPGMALSAAGIRAWATERLASFKVPARVVITEDWPMTATGKVRRARLREIAADLP